MRDLIFEEKERWPLWIPVLIGLGIALYFTLTYEPSYVTALLPLPLAVGVYMARSLRPAQIILSGLLAISCGFSSAWYRTHTINPHMIQNNMPTLLIEARVHHVERVAGVKKHATRLIIGDMVIVAEPDAKPMTLHETLPLVARITSRTKTPDLQPTDLIRAKIKLSPISEPLTTGSYDFRRHSYFQGIGATGYTLSPVALIERQPLVGWEKALSFVRHTLTHRLQLMLAHPESDIATALITGEKAGIPKDIRQAFADSGLAHVLAISGLHLSIVAGFVFLVMRGGLSFFPRLSGRYHIKKWAACGAMAVALLYLGISGASVPAVRAFFMTSLVMVGIILDRQPFSMRLVAMAAGLILLFIPDVLLGPSFQMSFAAVIALIAFYESTSKSVTAWVTRGPIWFRRLVVYGVGLLLTSFIATLATAPYTILTFHRFSLQGVLANLVAVPLTTLVIMPLAVIVSVSLFIHPSALLMKAFFYSLHALKMIAVTVATWPGAAILVPMLPAWTLPTVTFGALWLCLWKTGMRYLGLIPIAMACTSFYFTNPPDIMMDRDAKILAVASGHDSTLYVSNMRGAKFAKELWQGQQGFNNVESLDSLAACDLGGCRWMQNGFHIAVFYKNYAPPCETADILISFEPLRGRCLGRFLTIDRFDVWKKGGVALWLDGVKPKASYAFDGQGYRPWSRKAIARPKEGGV